MVTLGWIVIVLGILAVLAGIAGAIAQIFKDIASSKPLSLNDLPTDFVDALRLLIESLTKAPVYLVLLLAGFALIVYGGTLIR
jgi:hypothetical protein